jgi:hypothetical protein
MPHLNDGAIELRHFFHDNRDVRLPWTKTQFITQSCAGLGGIQSRFDSPMHGNFEVVVEEGQGAVVHYCHPNLHVEESWIRTDCFDTLLPHPQLAQSCPEDRATSWRVRSRRHAMPLFDEGCVGELSVRWNPLLGAWTCLYNAGWPADRGSAGGIVMRWSKRPYGPGPGATSRSRWTTVSASSCICRTLTTSRRVSVSTWPGCTVPTRFLNILGRPTTGCRSILPCLPGIPIR